MAKSRNAVISKKSAKTKSKAKSAAHEPQRSAKSEKQAEGLVTVNRRAESDRRSSADRRKASVPVAVERRKLQRREKVSRRRQIDPTTCERDYSSEEIEFMNALDQYKRTSGRMFPTCSEVLEVLRKLGYEKRVAVSEATPDAAQQNPSVPVEDASAPAVHACPETPAVTSADLSA